AWTRPARRASAPPLRSLPSPAPPVRMEGPDRISAESPFDTHPEAWPLQDREPPPAHEWLPAREPRPECDVQTHARRAARTLRDDAGHDAGSSRCIATY